MKIDIKDFSCAFGFDDDLKWFLKNNEIIDFKFYSHNYTETQVHLRAKVAYIVKDINHDH